MKSSMLYILHVLCWLASCSKWFQIQPWCARQAVHHCWAPLSTTNVTFNCILELNFYTLNAVLDGSSNRKIKQTRATSITEVFFSLTLIQTPTQRFFFWWVVCVHNSKFEQSNTDWLSSSCSFSLTRALFQQRTKSLEHSKSNIFSVHGLTSIMWHGADNTKETHSKYVRPIWNSILKHIIRAIFWFAPLFLFLSYCTLQGQIATRTRQWYRRAERWRLMSVQSATAHTRRAHGRLSVRPPAVRTSASGARDWYCYRGDTGTQHQRHAACKLSAFHPFHRTSGSDCNPRAFHL